MASVDQNDQKRHNNQPVGRRHDETDKNNQLSRHRSGGLCVVGSCVAGQDVGVGVVAPQLASPSRKWWRGGAFSRSPPHREGCCAATSPPEGVRLIIVDAACRLVPPPLSRGTHYRIRKVWWHVVVLCEAQRGVVVSMKCR